MVVDADEIRRLENARDIAVRKLMVVGKGSNKSEATYAQAWQRLRKARIENGEAVLQIRERMR